MCGRSSICRRTLDKVHTEPILSGRNMPLGDDKKITRATSRATVQPLDDSGLMRCRGRIQNSLLNQEAKTPILLPSKHHGVELINQGHTIECCTVE